MTSQQTHSSLLVYPSFLNRHFGPLLKKDGAMLALVFCGTVAAMLTWVDRSYVAQVQRNSALALFLSVELKREAGPNLHKARELQAHLIQTNMFEMQSPAILLIGKFYSKFSPVTQLSPAIDALLDEKSSMTDREALNKSQEILEQVGKLWNLHEDSSVSVVSYDSANRLQTADKFLQDFRVNMKDFLKSPDIKSGETACMGSRLAGAAVTAAWVDYDEKARKDVSKKLAVDLAVLHTKMLETSSKFVGEEKQYLEHYAANIKVREAYFRDMNTGGVAAGRKQLLIALGP